MAISTTWNTAATLGRRNVLAAYEARLTQLYV